MVVRGSWFAALLNAAAICACAACSSNPPPKPAGDVRAPEPVAVVDAGGAPAQASPLVTLSVVGTNDVHGHIDTLPILGGFVSALRANVTPDNVVLVDAGDMFQGTLESNLGEGAAVVRAYNVLQYDAVAIGNHEFDFGPVGPSALPRAPGDDPRGALRERAKQAHYPFLLGNVQDAKTGAMPTYEHMAPSVMLTKHGIKVGVVGVTTIETPKTTIAPNFEGLVMVPLADAVKKEAAALRAQGATVIILSAHAGGKCKNVTSPEADGQCDDDQEIMALLSALPAGMVDVVVAGHTHAGMATKVRGVPVIESFANGRAFGRVDVTVDPDTKKITASKVFPVTELKLPATYEGTTVMESSDVARAFADDLAQTKQRREQKLGVHLDARIRKSHDHESAEGNLFADLMRKARPKADVALTNGGGLRADLPEGDLTYGSLFEAMPFDNRFALLPLSGKELRHLLTENAKTERGILSVSGITVEVACKGGKLALTMRRTNAKGQPGAEVRDTDKLIIVTSDFVALGGDRAEIPKDRATMEDELIRDALEKGLTGKGELREKDVLEREHPRWKLPGERPVRCTP
jgi:2',3'-cyclic-nucleotide 2'-phosphodiesterase (5'-nucleotidase family)